MCGGGSSCAGAEHTRLAQGHTLRATPASPVPRWGGDIWLRRVLLCSVLTQPLDPPHPKCPKNPTSDTVRVSLGDVAPGVEASSLRPGVLNSLNWKGCCPSL